MSRYFYIDNEGKQKGTFSIEELQAENINKDTLVWTHGMKEWIRAGEVAELSFLFALSAGNYPSQSVTSPVYKNPQDELPTANISELKAPVMSVKDWLITYLIMIIPIANIVFLFIWAFGSSNENPNKVNWAKASLIWMAIGIVLYAFLLIFFFWIFGMSDMF